MVAALAEYYKVSTDYLLGANTGYLGNTNLSNPYLDNITMHDVMYDLQGLQRENRKELIKFVNYLKTTERHESARSRRKENRTGGKSGAE